MKKLLAIPALALAAVIPFAGTASAAPTHNSSLEAICNHEDFYLNFYQQAAYLYYFAGNTQMANNMVFYYEWVKVACSLDD